MSKGKTPKKKEMELFGFEKVVADVVRGAHVRVTRMEGKRGDRIIAKVLFDDKGFNAIDCNAENPHAALHIQHTSGSFANREAYGAFTHAITFKDLKNELPFHRPNTRHGYPTKRGDRLAMILAEVPEIGTTRTAALEGKGKGKHSENPALLTSQVWRR